MPFPSTTPPVKMRLERSAELVGAKPLHLLTQTALPLKSPTGAFIAPLRSANAVAPNAKYKIIIPLIMARAQRRPFQIVPQQRSSVVEGVKVHLTIEPLLQLVKAFAVLRQQPHTFGHYGLDGHIVGL